MALVTARGKDLGNYEDNWQAWVKEKVEGKPNIVLPPPPPPVTPIPVEKN